MKLNTYCLCHNKNINIDLKIQCFLVVFSQSSVPNIHSSRSKQQLYKVLIRLAHLQKTKRDRREISLPLWDIRVAEQEYDVRFCMEVAKYTKSSPKPQNSPKQCASVVSLHERCSLLITGIYEMATTKSHYFFNT